MLPFSDNCGKEKKCCSTIKHVDQVSHQKIPCGKKSSNFIFLKSISEIQNKQEQEFIATNLIGDLNLGDIYHFTLSTLLDFRIQNFYNFLIDIFYQTGRFTCILYSCFLC